METTGRGGWSVIRSTLNLPYLGMETWIGYMNERETVVLNLPYLGMETELAKTVEAKREVLNLPYLGMETHQHLATRCPTQRLIFLI